MTQTIADTPLAITDRLFFARADATIDRDAAAHITAGALTDADDGELFLEYRESESISLDDGRIRSAGFDTTLGFGLRAVAGEAAAYAHAGELSEAALRRAATTVGAVAHGHSGVVAEAPRASNARLYSDANPLTGMDFATRTAVLAEIDAYARGRDGRVKQVIASLSGEWQAVQIIRADQILTGALEVVEDAGSRVRKTVAGPVIQASAVLHGLKVGIDYLRGRTGDKAGMATDDELFI